MKQQKFISIIWGYHRQIFSFHKEENYHMLPLEIMSEEGFPCEIYAIDSQVQIEDDPNFIPGTQVIYHKNVWGYIRYLLKNRESLIYSNSLTLLTLFVGILGKKTIFMPHDSIFGSNCIKKMVIVFFYRFFTSIRVNTDAEVRELETIKKGLGKKIPLVVSMDFYTKRITFPHSNVIISLGNLIPKKRPEFLLEALKIVKNAGYDFTLRVIGEDRLKNHFPYSYDELVKKHELTGNVEVCGFVSHDLLSPYLEDAMLYINTSTQEGFCLALYEMSVAGLFPIIPRILSFDAVFGDGALYYPPYSPEVLAGHIMRVFEDRETCLALSHANQDFIKSNYNYAHIKKSLRNHLLELAR